jgi:DNA-binding CsgD family transcriptional regulator
MDGRRFDQLTQALARRLHQEAGTQPDVPVRQTGPARRLAGPMAQPPSGDGTCPYPGRATAAPGGAAAICGWQQLPALLASGQGVLAPARNGRGARRHRAQRLSPREQEVAALIGRGLKDREIAAALVLSERTVHAHVHNLLARLDLASRAQIAAWASEHGLLSGPQLGGGGSGRL